jgi:hypothetical protein
MLRTYNRRGDSMADKIIGSLIYGQHATPKQQRALRDRLKVPLLIGAVLLILGGAAYKFANYREEHLVKNFLEAVSSGRYEEAFVSWESDDHYTMKDFLSDWGAEGYYMKGGHNFSVADSNSSGSAVIVYVTTDNFKAPIAIRVNKETLKMSFSPVNKYTR